MKTPTQVVQSGKYRERDSSRLVIVSNLTRRGSPLVLCTIEECEDGTLVLRLPGGRAHRGESPKKCAHRERREETDIHQNDLDTDLKLGFVRLGRKYNVHVFYCGVEKRMLVKNLVPTDEKIKGLRWVSLTELLSLGTAFESFDGLKLQESHHRHLCQLRAEKPDFLQELYSCITVRKATKSAS